MSQEGGSGGGAGELSCKSEGECLRQHDSVFNELMQQCKSSAPGARLSAKLGTELERMSPAERRAVCDRKSKECAPLFVACSRGNVEIVKYLIHMCAADIEQRGVYALPGEPSVHTVTPLWCAAVSGCLDSVRVLAEAGADVNATSDSGSTPVRSACFMTNLSIVRYLVERGADVHRPNHNGGTCLINSVHCVGLCDFLLESGARVDARDTLLKTVLHYAIQEDREDTTRLLLDHGADPHVESRAGDDALRTACLEGSAEIVRLLVKRVCYSPSRLADAYELLGATLLEECDDVSAALSSWRRATAVRHAGVMTVIGYVPKRPARYLGTIASAALGDVREWCSPAELQAAAADVEALRKQALLVVARVLGPDHKDMVMRLMYRGASYIDAFQYQRCIDLWTWALQIRIQKHTLLYVETCHTACALTRLLLDTHSGRLEHAHGVPRHEDVLRVFRLFADNLPVCRRLLETRPVCRAQVDTFNRAMRCVMHVLHLLWENASTTAQRAAVRAATRRFVEADVRTVQTGDTLLHLAVSRLNVTRSIYFDDEMYIAPMFPNVAVAQLLLECGADACVRNEDRSTALHIAAIPHNYTTNMVEVLLAGGAHLDQPNKYGDNAGELVALNQDSDVRPLEHVTLACRAARALAEACPRVPRHLLPRDVHAFVDLHRP